MAGNEVERYRIVTLNRQDLKEHPKNPRTIGDAAKERLEKNLKRMGLVEPIIVNETTMRILSGHQRVATLDRLRKTKTYEIEVSMVSLTEAEELEQLIFLNNAEAMGHYDNDQLRELFGAGTLNVENCGFSVSELKMELGGLQVISAPIALAAKTEAPQATPAQSSQQPTGPTQKIQDTQPSIKIIFADAKACDRFLELLGVQAATQQESQTMSQFLEQFKLARRTGVPLVAVCTPDPGATIGAITATKNGEPMPLILHDCVRGPVGINDDGKTVITKILAGQPPISLAHPAKMLATAATLPAYSILCLANGHRFLQNEQVVQAIWNLRDVFKQNFQTLVILCPSIKLPSELQQDVLVLDEPLPNAAELSVIVRQTYEAANAEADAQITMPSEQFVQKAVDAICGLATFSAEQVCAMSLKKTGMDLNMLWERKRRQIEQTRGLSVWRGKETFAEISGLANAKTYFSKRGAGPQPPRCIVFIDEIDKHMSNFGASGTGDTTTEDVGALLTEMQDKEWEGSLFVGVPGVGKTMLAKAIANQWGVPLIQFDLSGMKASKVGESGENVRAGLKVSEAVGQGRVFCIATCNNIDNLPPELRRRFTNSTFFFDLSTPEELADAWKLYEKKWNIVAGKRPDDAGWTPAEVRNCCYNAYILSESLVNAAKYVVPVSKSASEKISALRHSAVDRYISASEPGFYKMPDEKPVATKPMRRIATGEPN